MENLEPDKQGLDASQSEPPARDYVWMLSCAVVAAIAAFIRFFQLELKPLHHDEGVNGYFLTTLFREGVYKYDPANYHGPDLYYLALAFSKLFGLNTLSVRSSVALFGVLTVVLAFFLRQYIGRTGALFAALFLAISPGMAFISRYFIHEILFVFFSLAVVVSIVLFLERRRAGFFSIAWTTLLLLICFLPSTLNLADKFGGESATTVWGIRTALFLIQTILVVFVMRMLLAWNGGHAIYLILASASTVLLFATKETGFITIGTMLIACGCVLIWRRLWNSDAVRTGRFTLMAAPTVAALVALALLSNRVKSFAGWLANEFFPLADPWQTSVFYGICVLIVLGVAAWFIILWALRTGGQDDSELSEPDVLDCATYCDRIRATDNWEILLVKSGIGALTVVVTWVFVRILVEMLIGSRGKGGAMAAWRKLEFANFDFAIIGLAFAMLLTAGAVYKWRRPEKISADLVLAVSAAIIVFLYVGALFFSSFFTFPDGLQGAFKAYAIWTKTGNTDHTQNGVFAYLKWGMKIEAPLLILSSLGFLIAFVRPRHKFALFAGLWSFGLFAAYTIIPYKTPWLALSFLLPMCISAGYALNEMFASRVLALRIVGGISAVLAAAVLAFQTYDINFERYDDDSMPYVYAHTKRDFLDLVAKIDYYAEKSGAGKDVAIEIVSSEYWPLPWYLNDYKHANFHGKMVDSNTSEMIVAKKVEQESEIIEEFAVHYRVAGEFPLRPGVDLVLLVRNDIADPYSPTVFEHFGAPVEIFPDDPATNRVTP